jgi:tetratricopeptide (TPR) repeat protein
MKTYRLNTVFCAGSLLLVLLTVSCAGPPTKKDESAPPVAERRDEKGLYEELSRRCRMKASEYEKTGELPKARQMWEIVSRLSPGDEEALRAMETISTQMRTMADQHFKKGTAYFQNKAIPAARREFLLALLYDPDHKEALDYIKNRLEGDDYTLYEVKQGDTLQGVAQKTYHDPGKDFLISYFNDLAMNARLTRGMTLKLPVLEPASAKRGASTEEHLWKPTVEEEPPAKSIDAPTLLTKAKNLFKAKKYKEVTTIVETILENDPRNAEARNLMNDSYYQMGKMSSSAKKYQEALTFFNHVDPRYKDVRESRAMVEKQLAEAHYVTGVRFYINEDLEKAINEWETTLALNPDHPKAKKDIENARALLRKLQELR